ncbi:phospholipid/glycerol acyltransferase [Solidesulfovibrio fructosivorans JJ]]|uniref:Phospholipid/glycerol acyltransferase n=1 Tax=Solidesulfovibrio fructosivorans JJ] TaxID=596151 RepID=E1JSH3_SOLFR|nr:GNAT family N-acyltransferase [Solidesulfovibrio fructosivorans]EFL52942.1 phospholipid/glycerol acyltransferase [Solidesulfovibrio fructosivorans JJ]]
MEQSERPHIFSLTPSFGGSFTRRAVALAEPFLAKALSLAPIEDIYRAIPNGLDGGAFVDAVLDAMDVRVRASSEELERIPKSGPVVVVANHPFGGLEGLVLAKMLLTVRPDTRIMANFLLSRIPELRGLFVFVDPFGGSSATGSNIRPLKECLRILRKGGLLGIFPAGAVAHPHLENGRPAISDPAWSATVARLVRKTEATVVPIHFSGRNSRLFQVLGLVHPLLRTAMLPREFYNKCGQAVEARIGTPIRYDRLAKVSSCDEEADTCITRYLRLRTELLRNRPDKPRRRPPLFPQKNVGHQEALIPPVSPALLADEIAALAPGSVLHQSGEFQVIEAKAADIPLMLREIGRLRELTFRRVGEGTGKACDLDGFDPFYHHLFLWNAEKREVAGAYRIGRTDELLAEKGPQGLYTSTLFVLKAAFFSRISPALEMGRSFVRPEYQKSYSPLLLLWKGLAQMVVREPRYRVLFGPVSITNDYKHASRRLMASYFEGNVTNPNLARLVRPKTPLRGQTWLARAARTLVEDLDDLLALIDDIEADRKGIPVLLRQYLKLGGKILAFNVDKGFADCLDGLIVVDLLQADRRQLERYMGKDGFASFTAYHQAQAATADARTSEERCA